MKQTTGDKDYNPDSRTALLAVHIDLDGYTGVFRLDRQAWLTQQTERDGEPIFVARGADIYLDRTIKGGSFTRVGEERERARDPEDGGYGIGGRYCGRGPSTTSSGQSEKESGLEVRRDQPNDVIDLCDSDSECELGSGDVESDDGIVELPWPSTLLDDCLTDEDEGAKAEETRRWRRESLPNPLDTDPYDAYLQSMSCRPNPPQSQSRGVFPPPMVRCLRRALPLRQNLLFYLPQNHPSPLSPRIFCKEASPPNTSPRSRLRRFCHRPSDWLLIHRHLCRNDPGIEHVQFYLRPVLLSIAPGRHQPCSPHTRGSRTFPHLAQSRMKDSRSQAEGNKGRTIFQARLA